MKSLAKQESKNKKEATKDNGDVASITSGEKSDSESSNHLSQLCLELFYFLIMNGKWMLFTTSLMISTLK